MTPLLWLLGALLVVTGLAGLVVPALPGTALIFIGLVIAAWADGFSRVGFGPLFLIAVLAVLSYVAEFGAAALGARRVGASRRAIAGAILGTFLGLPLGLVGVILGPLIGALVGEWTVERDLWRAGKVGIASWIGFVLGTAAKVALGVAMVAVFLLALFF
jgi:uncharacterized protein YqgC (DUF456 family)